MINKERIKFGAVDYEIILEDDFKSLSSEIKKWEPISKIFVVSEKKIAKLYYSDLKNELSKLKIEIDLIIMKGGEKNKHIRQVGKTYNELISKKADRKSLLIAFGGGVVGDYTGFIASTYLRGIRFVQVPTTLLACVDSSVGGKVAVNADFGKNMIGAFYQPLLVYAALYTLSTLKEKEWRCGYAEIIKHSLLSGNPFYESIQNIKLNQIKDKNILTHFIIESVRFKAHIVSQDEKETGLRAILNLGHTLGHAIESLTKYKKYSHGEAVAQGLVFAILVSIRFKNLDKIYLDQILEIMNNFGMKIHDKGLKIEKLISHMYHDKKTTDHKIKFILLEKLGTASFDTVLSEDDIRSTLKEYFSL
jgi:3-dehydroquinate synthase